MIEKLFKNRPAIVQIFFIILISALLYGSAFVSLQVQDFSKISLFSKLYGNFFIHIPLIVDVLVAWLLILFFGFLLNYIMQNNGIEKKQSFMTMFIFTSLSGMFKSFMVLSPVFLLIPILIGFINSIFNMYKNPNPSNEVLLISFLTAIGTILYTPAVLLLIIVWISISMFVTINFRLIIISLLGFITPFVFMHAYMFMTGKSLLLIAFMNESFNSDNLFLIPEFNFQFYIIVTLCLLFLSVLQPIYSARKDNTVNTHRKFTVLIFIFLVFFAEIILKAGLLNYTFVMMFIPFTVIFAFYFHNAKNSLIREVVFVLLIILSAANNYNLFD